MNRVEIKEKAKKIARENFKQFWAGYLMLIAVSFVLSFGIELLFDRESTIYAVLTLVASCFTSTLSVGFYSYLLKMVRKEEFSRNDIFAYIGKVLPILAISLLTAIFTFLWSILFIIPGIIAALSYSMVYLLYAEDQSSSAMDYLDQSKELMRGYKWDYFVFNLSFLGWMLLSVLTLGILFIWVIPYYSVAEVLYYDELKKLKEKN